MSENALKENKMGTMPIGKLLINMSLPVMISMLVQALYNVVDSMYVAQINEAALTAVSLAYPIQSLLIAIAVGTGIGINALLSKSLGMKDFDRANKATVNGLFLTLVTYVVFAAVSLPLINPFLSSQTDSGTIVSYGVQYLRIICTFSFAMLFQMTFEKILNSTGRTYLSMVSQLIGAVLNIALDPVLIFGKFGLPAMGVTGAAIATVFSQFVGALIAFFINIKFNRDVSFSLKKFRPSGAVIKSIYSVGAPAIIMQSVGAVFVYIVNAILITFTSTATAVFGVYYKLQSFVFMPIFGLNNGMVPIVSYNYGARRRDRIMKTFKICILSSYVIMGAGLALLQLFPEVILGMFNAGEEMLKIGVPALRIISLLFIPAGYSVIFSSFSQAMGNGVYSMILSMIRQIVVLVPVMWLLSLSGSLETVWWAFLIAEGIGTIVSLFFTRSIVKNKVNTIRPLDTQAF